MNDVEENRPKWMIDLENRKRKPRLAHEAGAGSPCLICKDSCPGLDLHFWRKICKNCKCGRDDHDVDDDEFPQFDLLFGPTGRPKKRATILRVANKKQPEKEAAFEWVPPNTTKELAADYIKALPEDKLPIKGSSGAALRRQQLQKQLPLHDIQHEACDELSEAERLEFEKYLENLKRFAGQGKVIKMMGARPFSESLMTPANAADMQPMSPQRKPQSHLPGSAPPTNLRTPSSFAPRVPPLPPLHAIYNQQAPLTANVEPVRSLAPGSSQYGAKVQLGQYHPTLQRVHAGGQVADSSTVNRLPQHLADQRQLVNTGDSRVQELGDTGLQKPRNVQVLAGVGTLERQDHLPQDGIRQECSLPRRFAEEEPVPAGARHHSQNWSANDRTASPGALHDPRLQIEHLESMANARNLVQGSQTVSPGRYHEIRVPLQQVAGNVMQVESPGTKRPGRSETIGNSGKQSQQTIEAGGATEDNLEKARRAEEMLSEALLPPSAVHAAEIIGSTLDRNKLKFIQQKLSAKYSKDESAAQKLLRSQQIDSEEPRFAESLGKARDKFKKPLSVDKEAERTAIIAAMRNPSGLLMESQSLKPVSADYSSPLKEEIAQQDADSKMLSGSEAQGSRDAGLKDDGREFVGGTDPGRRNQGEQRYLDELSSGPIVPGGTQKHLGEYPQGSAHQGRLGQNTDPLQQQYLDNSSSGPGSFPGVLGEQEKYLGRLPQGVIHQGRLGQNTDPSQQKYSDPNSSAGVPGDQQKYLGNHPQGILGQNIDPLQQQYSDNSSSGPGSFPGVLGEQEKYLGRHPQGVIHQGRLGQNTDPSQQQYSDSNSSAGVPGDQQKYLGNHPQGILGQNIDPLQQHYLDNSNPGAPGEQKKYLGNHPQGLIHQGRLGQGTAPMQQQYLDNSPSDPNSFSGVPGNQQKYSENHPQGLIQQGRLGENTGPSEQQYLDNSSTAPNSFSGVPGDQQIRSENYPQGLAHQNFDPSYQQYLDNASTDPNSFQPIPGGQQRYLENHPQSSGRNTDPAQHQYSDSFPSGPNSQHYPGTYDPNTTGDQRLQDLSGPAGNGPFTPSRQLQAELSYQPVNSHVIHSESLQNPVFPEGMIEAPGLRQNPASVDQLQGAMRELGMVPAQVQKCHHCKEAIHAGDVVVTAEKAKDAVWHPGCFVCSTCNELLADLVYFYHKDKLYCARDLATLLNIPRCFACDELIFVREYTVAEGHNYHIKHFCCWDCDVPLAGQQYISENDRPLCLPCFQKTYAKTCETCKKVIAADQQGVAVKNLDFHATDDCFCCFTCKKSLLSGKMAIKENKPFCSRECITEFQNGKV